MKATKLTLLSALAIAIVVGCSAGNSSERVSPQAGEAAASLPAQDFSPSVDAGWSGTADIPTRGGAEIQYKNGASNVARLVSNETPVMTRDVVKTGSLTVQVDEVDGAEKKARHIAESAGGRVDSVSSTELAGPYPTIDLTLRIPVSKFETSMEQLEGLGNRMAKQVSVQDVTEQMIDYDARMKTMLAQEQVVRSMLVKAKSLDDSLSINDNLTRLRGEIESIAGQRKSLSSQAAYSTLQVKLTQKATAVAVASTDPNWFQTSWASAWGAGTTAFRNVIGVLMWILVFSPIWITLLIVLRWLVKAANRPQQASVSVEGQRPA